MIIFTFQTEFNIFFFISDQQLKLTNDDLIDTAVNLSVFLVVFFQGIQQYQDVLTSLDTEIKPGVYFRQLHVKTVVVTIIVCNYTGNVSWKMIEASLDYTYIQFVLS